MKDFVRRLGDWIGHHRASVADALVVFILSVATLLLWWAPPPRAIATPTDVRTAHATVLAVDDSGLRKDGVVDAGTQRVEVRLPGGDGRIVTAYNELRGQPELDKRFVPGDEALLVIREKTPEEVAPDPDADYLDADELAQYGYVDQAEEKAAAEPEVSVIARDHWRLDRAGVLFAAFAVLLVAFGGTTGLRALFTFVFSCLAIWKLMVRYAIDGHSASLVAFTTVAVLTAAIIFLVAGLTRKGVAAFVGSMLGVISSFALARVAVWYLHINGTTMPYALQLLNSVLPGADLRDIFIGAVVLASSGAVMDLAMDIAAGVGEVHRHNPALGFRPLFASGLRIGRAVVGTMTTTLLLAYSGGYLTLMMVFAAEGTPPAEFINTSIVSAELVKTLVGSFGLVLVAPFTALVSAAIFAARKP